MVILFVVLVVCTVAIIAVALAIHFRVKRHLRQTMLEPPIKDQGTR